MPLFFLKPRPFSPEEVERWRLRDAAWKRELRQEVLALIEARARRTDLSPEQAAREFEAWLEARRLRPREAWELIREDRDWR